MKKQYRLVRRNIRGGMFYSYDTETGKRTSLGTANKEEAEQIINAKNQAARQPAMNMEMARVYLHHSDSAYATRTWQQVMNEMARHKNGDTQKRWERAMREEPFDFIRRKVVVETKAQDFLDVLANGGVCTNIFLRRLHNYALEMDWIPKAIIPRRQWPKIEFKSKRAVTFEEHKKIINGERNSEWQTFYQMLWHVGGSQSDVANLRAEDVDWKLHVISFNRMKTGSVVQLHFGKELESILSDLPGEGFLFPRIAKRHEKDRAKQFMRRCRLVEVQGVSLHSYRRKAPAISNMACRQQIVCERCQVCKIRRAFYAIRLPRNGLQNQLNVTRLEGQPFLSPVSASRSGGRAFPGSHVTGSPTPRSLTP